MKKVIITQKPEEPIVATEILAQAILSLSNSMRLLNQSRLKREAIVVLIHDRSKIGKRDIEVILNNLEQLSDDWLKPKRLSLL